MLLTLALPLINPTMTEASIDEVHVTAGAEVKSGSKLLDLKMDLSAAVRHDCPPVSYYRLVTLEQAWLRRLEARPDDRIKPGITIALFSTEPTESLDASPVRHIRVSLASIIKQEAWPEF